MEETNSGWEPEGEALEVAEFITHAYAVGKRITRHRGTRLTRYVVLEPTVIIPEWLAKDLEDVYEEYKVFMAGNPDLETAKPWLKEWQVRKDDLMVKAKKENIAK